MGREIRRVPPNWEHPQEKKYDPFRRVTETVYKPLHDGPCEGAWANWQARYQLWLDGEHDRIIEKYGEADYLKGQPYASFCEWEGLPPDPKYFRPPWEEGTQTWYQVYETVSEGTPVTPPFATQDELIDYLVENGDFWDQKRREEGTLSMPCEPWPREQAEKFVYDIGWAPSMVVDHGKVLSGVEAVTGISVTKENTDDSKS